MKLLGPCTFNQAALPYIFENVPQSYHQRSMDIFERNAKVCYEMLKDVAGISPIMPTGAMYMMVSYNMASLYESSTFDQHCRSPDLQLKSKNTAVILLIPYQKYSNTSRNSGGRG